jgi:ornithine carbamoyltransferase
MMKRDFLAITDLTTVEIKDLFRLTRELKGKQKRGDVFHPLKGQTLAMIFQKPSARTRVSFEVGMIQLGGHAINLTPSDIGMGKRESVADVARVMSRYCDGIMARVFEHDILIELARYAPVPVINGLSDLFHPCQVLGDLFTIQEHLGKTEGIKVVFVGDGNNVANSWINAASRLKFSFYLACPKGYDPDEKILKNAQKAGMGEIVVLRDPQEAVRDADVIYTDVWTSMGQEKESAKRRKAFKDFQVNERLLAAAKSSVKVMHCLPAHRGEEITEGVMEGSHSIVFDEAENRLHIQKAILVTLMGGK